MVDQRVARKVCHFFYEERQPIVWKKADRFSEEGKLRYENFLELHIGQAGFAFLVRLALHLGKSQWLFNLSQAGKGANQC